MGNEQDDGDLRSDELHARIVAVMEELDLPSPERMLSRIEKMLATKDWDSVLRHLLQGFQEQSRDDMARALKALAPGHDEWAAEVEQLLNAYPPT